MSERAPSHRAQVFSDQRANQKALIRKDYLGSARDRSAPAHVQTTLQIKQISISCSEIKQKESCLFQREPSERFPMPVKHEFKRPMLMKTLVALNDAHGTYSMHRLVARSVGRHACMHALNHLTMLMVARCCWTDNLNGTNASRSGHNSS